MHGGGTSVLRRSQPLSGHGVYRHQLNSETTRPRAWPLIGGPEWNSHATCRSVMQAGMKCQAGQRGDVTLLFCASAGAQVHAASRAILGVITLVRLHDCEETKEPDVDCQSISM